MPSNPFDRETPFQIVATVIASSTVFFCAVAVLWEFVPALLWATVLVIALWPVYERIARWHPSSQWTRLAAPLTSTLLLGLLLALPLAFAAIELGHAANAIVQWTARAQHNGIPVPALIAQLPYVGVALAVWWRDNLSDPQAATDLFGQIGPDQVVTWSRAFGEKIGHGIITYLATFLALFMLFRDGPVLRVRFSNFGHNVFGERGELIARHAVDAIYGTVTGLVLVGLAEGALIGIGYWVAGVPHTFLFTVTTGILAVIPMGAPVAFTVAAGLLYFEGHIAAAAGVFAAGLLVVMIADYVVRPILIGGAARLPFLLVLLGTLGGLGTLGLIGIFVGPVLMAVLLALWRDFSGLPE